MPPSFGHDVLAPFEVPGEAREFLAELIESHSAAQEEVQKLVHESLLAGCDDWHYLIDCANSLKDAGCVQRHELDGNDVLTFIWQALKVSTPKPSPIIPWASTDRLIAQAKALEHDAEAQLSALRVGANCIPEKIPPASTTVSTKRKPQGSTSHYWSNEHQLTDFPEPQTVVFKAVRPPGLLQSRRPPLPNPRSSLLNGVDLHHQSSDKQNTSDICPRTLSLSKDSQSFSPSTPIAGPSSATESHYFNTAEPCPIQHTSKRPPAGIVSSVPFPPLTASCFGIVQEELAHDPFWLLIAITFLIKTRGTQAIPIFYKVKERFPTPSHLADPAIQEELLGMIRHLGLSLVRVAYIQKYAKAFLETPPEAGVKYKIKTYGKKGTTSWPDGFQDSPATRDLVYNHLEENAPAWEIGHMTSGKYAIDSWRIFCRDELLGRAEDWNGKGREPEFQPEWMRIMPDDKELRAYLRWMWMREGWEWDPATGERTVLRAEMQRAVDEGRVEYDNTGGLRILDEVGSDGSSGQCPV